LAVESTPSLWTMSFPRGEFSQNPLPSVSSAAQPSRVPKIATRSQRCVPALPPHLANGTARAQHLVAGAALVTRPRLAGCRERKAGLCLSLSLTPCYMGHLYFFLNGGMIALSCHPIDRSIERTNQTVCIYARRSGQIASAARQHTQRIQV
jgi:hypothetical protein